MAGKPSTREENETLRKRVGELEADLNEARKLLAIHAPEALTGKLAEPVKEYTPALCERVLAMGAAGMRESEWIAAFNVSVSTWDDWKAMNPALQDACERAFAQCQAYWDALATKAATTNNNRFPMQVYNAIKAETMNTGNAKGDASKLVIVDLRDRT